MKTNRSIRRLARVRSAIILLAVLTLLTAEFRVGESLATRSGKVAASRTDYPQAPAVGLADLMAAAAR